MKAIIVAAALLISAPCLLAGSGPDAQQLLATANQQREIFGDHGTPLELQIDFVAQLNVPTNGHLTLRWAAKNRWWAKVSMGAYLQISIQDGEWTYTARNLGFTPIRVRQLINLIGLTEEPPYIGKKARQRSEDGVRITCLQATREDSRQDEREICLDPASTDILSQAWSWQPDWKGRERYSDYFEFEGHRYPRKLKYEENGSRVVKAEVTSLVAVSFNESLLKPPKGAIGRRHCPGLKPAVPIKKVELPTIGSAGDNTVAMTILTDGSVGDIQLIVRSGGKLDEAAIAALNQWKFKPAMCGTDPVVSEIEITTSVRKY
jgi:TonB family protein